MECTGTVLYRVKTAPCVPLPYELNVVFNECGKMKTAVIFIPAGMEITAVLYFLRNGVKLHFYSLGTIFEENIWGVQRGEIP